MSLTLGGSPSRCIPGLRCHCEAQSAEAIWKEGRNYCLRLPRFARNDKKCLYSQTKRIMCDMYKYLVIFEKAGDNYSAYSPDIPGCIATGATRDEAEKNIREAINFHIEGLKEDGLPVPEPAAFTEYIEV